MGGRLRLRDQSCPDSTKTELSRKAIGQLNAEYRAKPFFIGDQQSAERLTCKRNHLPLIAAAISKQFSLVGAAMLRKAQRKCNGKLRPYAPSALKYRNTVANGMPHVLHRIGIRPVLEVSETLKCAGALPCPAATQHMLRLMPATKEFTVNAWCALPARSLHRCIHCRFHCPLWSSIHGPAVVVAVFRPRQRRPTC